jgi:single-strand DNA-binding protein
VPADLNRVTLIGRLTRDPELRHSRSGDAIASLRIAVNSRARGDGGEWTDKPNFFDVSVFGRQAETVSNYMAKGRRIGIDGRLQWREWETQDGSKRQSVEVVANDVFFLDNRGDGDAGGTGGGWSSQSAPATPGGDLPVDTSDLSSPAPAPAGDDDIPF